MRVKTTYANFSRAKIDHDMNSRFDLPIFQTGADKFENFISNFKGNALYRPGFEFMLEFQDCVFAEFKFNSAQNYIVVLYELTMRFLSYDVNGDFGWVLNGIGDVLEVSHPYTLEQCRDLDYSQNSDVMVFTHPTFEPYKLTRISATSFTFLTFVRTVDPFTGTGLYPAKVLFYKGRLYYANSTTKPTTVWASVAGSYDDFTLTPVTDSTALVFTIADIAQPIEWLTPGSNSLIAGASDGIVAINGGGVGETITAATVEATITSAPGCSSSKPLAKDGLIFYVGREERNLYYFSYDLLTESFIAKDANFISYDISLGGLGKIRYKKDRNDLIYAVNDGNILSCNFKSDENVIGWHDHKTDGDFQDIAVITDNDGNPQLFTLTLRDGTYYIERKAPFVEFSKRVDFLSEYDGRAEAKTVEVLDNDAYIRKVSEELKSCIFLDNSQTVSNLQSNSITFTGNDTITATNNVFSAGDVGKHIVYKTDTGYEFGRFEIVAYVTAKIVTVEVLQTPSENTYTDWYLTFMTITGLSQYNGTTVSVVTDGGYLDDFEVSGGQIELEAQTTHAVIGYKYKGIIKSFNLGFQVQTDNTQTTMKAVTEFGIRCVSTAGLKCGTSLYKLERVQELGQGDLNYLPPLPIDGSKYVQYTDDHQKEKFFYIVQDEPLPAQICGVMLNSQYAVTQ